MSRARAKCGEWRILAPAALGWPIACASVCLPGSAVWVLAAGAVLAAASCACALGGRGGALRLVAVLAAVLMLLGARIAAQEHVRADPALGEAARGRNEVTLHVTLDGFPRALGTSESAPRADSGRARDGPPAPGDQSSAGTGWVRALVQVPRGNVPVVLWFGQRSARHPQAGAQPGPGSYPGLDEQRSIMTWGSGSPENAARWGPGTQLKVLGAVRQLAPSSSAAYGIIVGEASEVGGGTGKRLGLASTTELPAQLRAGLLAAADRFPGAELVPGFAVGDTSLVSSELDSAMRESSLSHLTAVSGANCALVTGAVLAVAGRLGVRKRLRALLACGGLAGFVLVVGPDASVQRAAIMGAVVLVGDFGGRRARALPALGTAIIVLLLGDPWQALAPGFVLSVAATAGILLLGPVLDRGMRRVAPVPRVLRLALVTTLAAQLAVAPPLLLLADGLPVGGVVANLVAAPAAPLGTGLGLLGAVLLPLNESIGLVAVAMASLPARWVSATAELFADAPGARLAWPGGWAGALLLTLALILAGLALGAARVRPGAQGAGLRPWAPRPRVSPGRLTAALMLGAASTGILAGPVVVGPGVAALGTPGSWRLVACDVGQGDAVLIRGPGERGPVALFDTGDDEEKLTRCLQRFGVSRIDLLVLTHDDRDHTGALGVAAPLAARALVAPAPRSATERPVLAALALHGVPTRTASEGQRGVLGAARGPLEADALTWEVLSPPHRVRPADANSASVVARVEAGGMSVLMLGDTGEAEQRRLLQHRGAVDVDVVKIAHHGSANHSGALLTAADPELALISVGAANPYGHPAAATLHDIAHAGARALRTDQLGSIAISGSPGALQVWAERPGSGPAASRLPGIGGDGSGVGAGSSRQAPACVRGAVLAGGARGGRATPRLMSAVPSRLEAWQQHEARRRRSPPSTGRRLSPRPSCW